MTGHLSTNVHGDRGHVRFSLLTYLCHASCFVFVQERTAAGAIGAVHVQQTGRWAEHVDHPQHPAGRRRNLLLQGHQQGRISGERALPQSVR